MSDRDLIGALRWCANKNCCIGCPGENVCDACSGKAVSDAADRLEALLAENERLKAGKDTDVPTKWVSVGERLPKRNEEVLVLTAPGTLSVGQNQVVAEYIHPINEKFGAFINFYAGYDDKNLLSVTHWMPLPEHPSTEGVE